MACALTTSLAGQNANNQAKKDSLRRVIPTLEWKEQVNAYEELGNIYFVETSDQQTMDSLLAVYKEMDTEAQKQNDLQVQSQIKSNILGAYLNINLFDKVIELAPEYLIFIEKSELWRNYSVAYSYYASAWLRKGDYEKAVQIAREMYESAKSREDKNGMAAAYHQIAVTYESTARIDEAEFYVRQAIGLIKDNERISHDILSYYFRLCNVLKVQTRFEEALQVIHEYEKAVEKIQGQSTTPVPASYWVNIWSLYSLVYNGMGEYGKSEVYLDKIDEIDVGSPIVKKNNYRKRAHILMQRKEYEKALELLEKAIEIPPYIDYATGAALWSKATILSYMSRTEDAVKCFETAVDISDSIRNREFNKQLDELRVFHEVDAITAKSELKQKQLVYSLAGSSLLIIALVIWVLYSRRLQKKNIRLVKQILEQDKRYDETKAHLNEIERLRQIAQTSNYLPEEDAEEKDELFVQLEQYMDEEKPYTNHELNRKMLADMMGTNEKYLRNVIKKYADITVSDYITLYRLKYANKLLMLPAKDYTIETIAIKSGFGSRDQFHKCYRANYELTPNEFRKIIQNQDNKDIAEEV